jgi:hypothetical protein
MTSDRRLIAVAAALALSACTTAGPPAPPPPPHGAGGPATAELFRTQDFSWSAVPGKGRILGHLSYHAGPVRYGCVGASVILTPETPWTRRRIGILYSSAAAAALPVDEVRARTAQAPNGDYSAFVRRTTCDANGAFDFEGLPNGAWFVILVAKPVGGGAPDMAIMRRVEVRAGRPTMLEL